MNEKYTLQGHRKEVTEEIVKMIKTGTAPWQKPWKPERVEGYLVSGIPRNAITNRPYRGMNAIHLFSVGFRKESSDPRWCTFKQASDNGWKVKKGAKSVAIEYWITTQKVERENKETGKKEKVEVDLAPSDFKYRVYRVFNAADIEGIPPLKPVPTIDAPEGSPEQKAEIILKNSGADISYNQIDRAFYDPQSDKICLPPKLAFEEQEDFYHTALHELSHWTGAKNRLNRECRNGFGTPEYAREELRADMGSFFTCVSLGISYKPDKTASYVDSWLGALNKNTNELFTAAKDADKIANYLLAFAKEKEHQHEADEIKPAIEKKIDNKDGKKELSEEERRHIITSTDKKPSERLNELLGITPEKEKEQQYINDRKQADSIDKKPLIIDEKKLQHISKYKPNNTKTIAAAYFTKAQKLLLASNGIWKDNFNKKIASELISEGRKSFYVKTTINSYSPVKVDVPKLSRTVDEFVKDYRRNILSR